MPIRNSPLFLERKSYRRKRIMDGARALPLLGSVLILLPALWTKGGEMGTAGEAVYVFALWIWLIVVAALLSRPLHAALRRASKPPVSEETPEQDAPQ